MFSRGVCKYEYIIEKMCPKQTQIQIRPVGGFFIYLSILDAHIQTVDGLFSCYFLKALQKASQ